jgi:Flp pilus assembly protein TadD
VYELITISGLPEADALRAVYTLVCGGYLRRDPPPQAFTPEALCKARAMNDAQAKAASATTAADATPVIEEKSAPAKPDLVEEVDEGLELEELFARLERATNYYHVLGVSRRASQDQIKQTYHRLARRFHPDRFHLSDASLHARVENAFAQIAQAYETLKDKQTRAVYDMKIEREGTIYPKEKSAPRESAQNVKAKTTTGGTEAQPSTVSPTSSPTQQAEESFKQGLAALQRGNSNLAMTLIGEAARLAPKQPRYRAYYGRALAANPETRRQAEAEIQAAIALDANNVAYRVMLAEFYREIGFQRRAQGELERALSIDPRNLAARRMLDNLKQKG